MCCEAIKKVDRIKRVVYGCKNDRFGGMGGVRGGVGEIGEGGVREREGRERLKKFYESTNRAAPESKRRKKNKKKRVGAM